jgi:hypothetical protein
MKNSLFASIGECRVSIKNLTIPPIGIDLARRFGMLLDTRRQCSRRRPARYLSAEVASEYVDCG